MLNITTINIIGIIIALMIFLLYSKVCAYFLQQINHRTFSIANFKNNYFSLSIILIISIIFINFLFYKFGYSIKFFAICIFTYFMLLLAAIDFKTQMLPDIITKPMIFLGLVQGYFHIFTNIESAFFGAIFGYFILWVVNFCYKKVRGIDGMGYGDFKLLSAIGAWTGLNMLPLIILLSSVVGIFVALVIIRLTKSNLKAPTPFGPSLVFTGFVAILYGNDIINWYISLL